MPIWRKTCFEKFVREVLEFTIQEAFCLLYSKLWIPWNITWHFRFDCAFPIAAAPLCAERVKKEFR